MKLIVWAFWGGIESTHVILPDVDAIQLRASVHIDSIVMLSDGPALMLDGPVWAIERKRDGMRSIWISGEAPPLVSPGPGMLLAGYEL